jgi:hypothetical protein
MTPPVMPRLRKVGRSHLSASNRVHRFIGVSKDAAGRCDVFGHSRVISSESSAVRQVTAPQAAWM